VGDGGVDSVRACFERPVGGATEREKGRDRGADRWAAAQCRAAVPLTGGSGMSVGTG
jgi:hypothetical protein